MWKCLRFYLYPKIKSYLKFEKKLISKVGWAKLRAAQHQTLSQTKYCINKQPLNLRKTDLFRNKQFP